jgi:hypothetical protein
MAGEQAHGLHIAFTRFFERLFRLLRDIRNGLRRIGRSTIRMRVERPDKCCYVRRLPRHLSAYPCSGNRRNAAFLSHRPPNTRTWRRQSNRRRQNHAFALGLADIAAIENTLNPLPQFHGNERLVPSLDWGRCTATAQASVLLADGAHDARSRAAIARGALHLLEDRLVIRGNRRH